LFKYLINGFASSNYRLSNILTEFLTVLKFFLYVVNLVHMIYVLQFVKKYWNVMFFFLFLYVNPTLE